MTAVIPEMGNYNQLFVVGVDSDSVVSRNMEVNKLLGVKDIPQLPMRDLTLNKKVGQDDKGITESRLTDCLAKDCFVHIEDITSSKVQIIDNVEKIYKILTELNGNN